MTDQDKIDAIISKLNEDTPTTSTGKIMQQVLIHTIPTLMTAQLDQIIEALGL